MTFRMGYWDCPSCKQKKNLGPNATCGQCGLPRGPNIPFYTDDAAPTIEDPALVARARAGADWKCKFCGSDNMAGVLDCHNCGAGPDGTVKRQEKFIAVATSNPPQKRATWKLVLGIVLAVLASLGLLIYFLFVRTKALDVTVESVAWVKTVEVEELVTDRRESWKDDVPGGATRIRSESKSRSKTVQDGTKKVKVGKKDLGNGMFEDVYKDEPNMVTKQVDDTWVTYEVEEWRKKDVVKSESIDGSEPKDPQPSGAMGARRRIGERTNKAVFQLKGSDGKRYSYDVDVGSMGAAAITKYEVGKKYTAQVTAAGGVQKLGP